jgi:2,3-bisphosphoglycerate-independent phosphoglycerate mutase
VVDATVATGGVVLLTADHGNVEQMIDPETGGVQTAHTLNPVECILIGPEEAVRGVSLHGPGVLADVGATVLSLLGLAIPGEMDGHDLTKPRT